MYRREITKLLKSVASKYPVITLIGPRQSGKSTLSRAVFSSYTYVSLEEPDQRRLALDDPRGFFKKYQGDLVIDEVQRAPELLSYIQTLVDEPESTRRFVLTGSHQLLLMEKVTQSLAGRTFICKLLPFSRKELLPHQPTQDLETQIFTGGYPRIYDKALSPTQWLEQYYQTYVERDVRILTRVADLDLFDRFVRLCAGRSGQLLNLASLGSDCGISQPTANAWLGMLQTSFLCFTLAPHFKNFSKRLIKSPKLYFYDTGLLCYLLKVEKPDALLHHPLRGSIFENWVITERIKSYLNQGWEPPLYFWRDTKGHEVDLVIDEGEHLYPVEIKSGRTFHSDFVKDIHYLNHLQKQQQGECIYAGDDSFEFKGLKIRSWSKLEP